ncbi:MAG: hypothetical protein ACYDD6_09315, partial [Acidimicrobiales bacterium]
PVQVTVTGCRGLIGGSGSNPVGYDCTGTYGVDGRRYSRHIPDDTLHAKGARVQGLTVPSDPGLLSTPAIVAGERASWRVFTLPTVLAVAVALAVGALALARRRA